MLQNQRNEANSILEGAFERRGLYLKDPKDGGVFVRSYVGCICVRLMLFCVMP